ncbi:MAG: 4'-phosphopantetheinyl transferase superfamily protein [Ktedonobacteraceae bacterium]
MTSWEVPPTDKTLHADEVHVWLADQKIFLTAIPVLYRLLNVDEVRKAAQFRFEKDRNRYIIAHGLLRLLLANYVQLPAAQLNYCYNAYGKPELAISHGQDTLHFNLSHTHELIIYAFTYSRHVGIDIEYIRGNIEYEQLAKHYFSSFEYAELQRLPLSIRRQVFFQCWTRKEAYIKARGLGLSLGLDTFDITVQPGLPVRLLASRENAQETTRWLFAPLPIDADYAGTLVVERQDWHMCCWQLLPSSIVK